MEEEGPDEMEVAAQANEERAKEEGYVSLFLFL
jgi:hypothetical protein